MYGSFFSPPNWNLSLKEMDPCMIKTDCSAPSNYAPDPSHGVVLFLLPLQQSFSVCVHVHGSSCTIRLENFACSTI